MAIFICQNVECKKQFKRRNNQNFPPKYCCQRCKYDTMIDTGKSKLNDDFFTFKLPQYAYTMGYLWADGGISRKGISLSIVKEDGDAISKILDSVGYWLKCDNPQKVGRTQRLFIISSITLAQKMQKLDFGLKSTISPNKIISLIPDDNIKYFLRGFVDGDGCWYINKKKNKVFTLSGSDIQDWSWVYNIFQRLGIKNYKYKISTDNRNYSWSVISLYSYQEIYKLGEYIYSDNTEIGLQRKYQKYLEIKNNYISSITKPDLS